MTNPIQACDFPALWASLVNSGDVEQVIALYQDHPILMPTFSPHTVKDETRLREYFTQLASREGLAVKLHESTVVCQKTGETSYVITGIYSFMFDVDGTILTFPSRFTFVIDLNNEKPIIHHHSSQVPRNLN